MFSDKYDYALVLIMIMILNGDELILVVNSYMQIDGDRMYEKCRCLYW